MNFEVPEEFGGPGLGALDTCLVLEELNYGCAGITNAVAANGLATHPLLDRGDRRAAQALSRASSSASARSPRTASPSRAPGSDVAGMSTTYRRVGDEFVLNGTKHFISNGSVAQWYVAFATRDRKMRHRGHLGVRLPGRSPRHQEASHEEQARPARGGHVGGRVRGRAAPEGRAARRRGRRASRSRCRPSIAAGRRSARSASASRSARSTSAPATPRSASSSARPIAQFQAIQFMLADMAIEVEAMRLLTYKAAWLHRPGGDGVRSCRATPRRSAPTTPCRSPPTPCRSSADTAT